MKYTREQLAPKRYPENKPSMTGVSYWTNLKIGGSAWFWGLMGWASKEIANKITWFIDIPGAPEEVKPQAYPTVKPEREGTYIFHHIGMDKWYRGYWNGRYFQINEDNSNKLARDIDYFIPVRLEDLDGDEMKGNSVLWNGKDIYVEIDKHGLWIGQPDSEDDPVIASKDEFTELCKHWLDLQGYDVTKRQPEIAPCPFCGGKCYNDEAGSHSKKEDEHWIECETCEYHSKHCDTPEEAIRLHKLIAERKA